MKFALISATFIVFMLAMDHIGTSYNDAARLAVGIVLAIAGVVLLAYLSWLDQGYRQ